MIGTALLTEARIHVQLAETVCASGSLGGLQVHSLLPSGSQLHQRLISVGKDPTAEENKKERSNIHTSLYNQDTPGHGYDSQKGAFSFIINYQTKGKKNIDSYPKAKDV